VIDRIKAKSDYLAQPSNYRKIYPGRLLFNEYLAKLFEKKKSIEGRKKKEHKNKDDKEQIRDKLETKS
jgi:hypothetical protein